LSGDCAKLCFTYIFNCDFSHFSKCAKWESWVKNGVKIAQQQQGFGNIYYTSAALKLFWVTIIVCGDDCH
jgi:hypothetical protein